MANEHKWKEHAFRGCSEQTGFPEHQNVCEMLLVSRRALSGVPGKVSPTFAYCPSSALVVRNPLGDAGFGSSVTDACDWQAAPRQQRKQSFIQALVDNSG